MPFYVRWIILAAENVCRNERGFMEERLDCIEFETEDGEKILDKASNSASSSTNS